MDMIPKSGYRGSYQGARDTAAVASLGVGFLQGLQGAQEMARQRQYQAFQQGIETRRLQLAETAQQREGEQFQWQKARQTEMDALAQQEERRRTLEAMYQAEESRKRWAAEQNMKQQELQLRQQSEARQQQEFMLRAKEAGLKALEMGVVLSPPDAPMPPGMQGPPAPATPWSFGAAMGSPDDSLEGAMLGTGKRDRQGRQIAGLAGDFVRRNAGRPAVVDFEGNPITLGKSTVSWDDLRRNPERLSEIAFALNEKASSGLDMASLLQEGGGTTVNVGSGPQSKLQRMGFRSPAEFVQYVGTAVKMDPSRLESYLRGGRLPKDMGGMDEKLGAAGDVSLGRQDTRDGRTVQPTGDRDVGGHGQVNSAMATGIRRPNANMPIALQEEMRKSAETQLFQETGEEHFNRVVGTEMAQIFQRARQGDPQAWIAAWKRGMVKPEAVPPQVWIQTGETPPPHVLAMIRERAAQMRQSMQPQSQPAKQ